MGRSLPFLGSIYCKLHADKWTQRVCNCEDTVNLESLMVMAYNLKLKDTPFRGIHDLPLPIAPEIPFKADLATVGRVKNMGGWSWD